MDSFSSGAPQKLSITSIRLRLTNAIIVSMRDAVFREEEKSSNNTLNTR